MSNETALRERYAITDTDVLTAMWRDEERMHWAEAVLRDEVWQAIEAGVIAFLLVGMCAWMLVAGPTRPAEPPADETSVMDSRD